MHDKYISPKTLEKLSGNVPVGGRHQAILECALDLIGNHWTPEETFAKIRPAFPAEKTDKEIWDAINGAIDKRPTPSGYGDQTPASPTPRPYTPKPKEPQRSPMEQAEWWLSGALTSQTTFTERSPITIPEGAIEAASLLLQSLYAPDERLNVVCQFTVNEKGKANPQGGGKIQTREEWTRWFADKGVPHSSAGAWFRPNPVAERGSGKEGAITDADVTACRFILIESDVLPLETQLALYARLKLPIAAVIHSGGDSAHAWVRVDCESKEDYSATANRLIAALSPFGFDKANKNPSRLSRLAGAVRQIGASGDGIQRLLWLNPDTKPLTETALAAFEESLKFPYIDEKPFQSVLAGAATRYQELIQNRGKLGVPTGIKKFDEVSGGLKGGQMIVVAAKTGGGKTTVATNIINEACYNNGVGVALFSLEMDRDEICDLFVAMNGPVNRNNFNTGNFTEQELNHIMRITPSLSAMPLFVFDDPMMTAPQIRQRAMQLKREGRIGLICVDYAQLISCDQFKDNREQQVATISRDLRALAKESKLPVIVLSQLNDEGKIRESRVLAHDAHAVILVEESEGDLLIKVVKGRRIPRGDYRMLFKREFSLIENP